MSRDVVMFHVGRCGSTVLGSLLGQHPGVVWDGEIFERQKRKWWRSRVTPMHYLQLRRLTQRPRGSLYGIEIKYLRDQHLADIGLDLPDLLIWLKHRSISNFVVLHRENYLRRMISHQVAVRTGIYQRRDEEAPAVPKIHLAGGIRVGHSVRTLVGWFEVFDEEAQRIRSLLGESTCYLTYERHIEQDPLVAYRRVARFLGLEEFEPVVEHRRTTPQDATEIVADFEKVVDELRSTRWAWMLNDLPAGCP